MDPFKDFNIRFERARRRGQLFSAFVSLWIGAIFVLVVGGFIFAAATALRLGPDGMAREAGRLTATFEQGYESQRSAQ